MGEINQISRTGARKAWEGKRVPYLTKKRRQFSVMAGGKRVSNIKFRRKEGSQAV